MALPGSLRKSIMRVIDKYLMHNTFCLMLKFRKEGPFVNSESTKFFKDVGFAFGWNTIFPYYRTQERFFLII